MATPPDVKAFIQFLIDVDAVGAAIPLMERTLRIITNLFNVAQQFDVLVTEEEMALYKSLFPQFRYLEVRKC